MYIPFEELSENSKIWIYQSGRKLTDDEVVKISEQLHTYTQTWQAHGADLRASYRVMYNHFVVLAVDEDANSATGCSIDDSVRAMQSIQKVVDVDLFDRLSITYKDHDGRVKLVSKKVFVEMLQTGELSKNTIVFNNMVTQLGEFEKNWEIPAHESWHSRLLPKT
ncbi:MAG: ABC transporter ATPase [Schleiferiaceae bacterium]|jgi:hypothetical protein|nr:ABC transporter ATPase [Schleiferiaceae bacterium]